MELDLTHSWNYGFPLTFRLFLAQVSQVAHAAQNAVTAAATRQEPNEPEDVAMADAAERIEFNPTRRKPQTAAIASNSAANRITQAQKSLMDLAVGQLEEDVQLQVCHRESVSILARLAISIRFIQQCREAFAA